MFVTWPTVGLGGRAGTSETVLWRTPELRGGWAGRCHRPRAAAGPGGAGVVAADSLRLTSLVPGSPWHCIVLREA